MFSSLQSRFLQSIFTLQQTLLAVIWQGMFEQAILLILAMVFFQVSYQPFIILSYRKIYRTESINGATFLYLDEERSASPQNMIISTITLVPTKQGKSLP